MSDNKDAIDNFNNVVDRDGVAVSSVNGGYILMFKREKMQEIIDQHPDDEKLIIFVQTAVLN